MELSRRAFLSAAVVACDASAFGLDGAHPAQSKQARLLDGSPPRAEAAGPASRRAQFLEHRLYAPEAIPPAALLKRNGLAPVAQDRTKDGEQLYVFGFESLEERCRAWDRMNTDPEWARIRESGTVRLRELRLYRAIAQPGGKILAISL
jgi:hypothetical protein